MLSLRLQKIASLVGDNEKVIDIGTDHAYIPIYLVNNRHFAHVWASDISPQVLKQSRENITKYHLEKQITLIKTSGFQNITEDFDVAIIAGMGAHTITDILSKAAKLPKSLIIQSNNNLAYLRTFLNAFEYKIVKEQVIYEKKKYYVIIRYEKGKENLSKEEIEFGKNYNLNYLNYLLYKYQEIAKKNPHSDYQLKITKLQNFIEKIPD